MSESTDRKDSGSVAVDTPQATRPRGWDPISMFSGFESELERFFGRRLPSLWPLGQTLRAGGDWAPSVDVFEKDGKLVVQAELPGVSRDDINVTLEDNDLVIRGQRSTEDEVNEDAYYRMERSYGSFYRRLPLPNGTQSSDLGAEFKDGVLTITVNRPAEAASKPVKVNIT